MRLLRRRDEAVRTGATPAAAAWSSSPSCDDARLPVDEALLLLRARVDAAEAETDAAEGGNEAEAPGNTPPPPLLLLLSSFLLLLDAATDEEDE